MHTEGASHLVVLQVKPSVIQVNLGYIANACEQHCGGVKYVLARASEQGSRAFAYWHVPAHDLNPKQCCPTRIVLCSVHVVCNTVTATMPRVNTLASLDVRLQDQI